MKLSMGSLFGPLKKNKTTKSKTRSISRSASSSFGSTATTASSASSTPKTVLLPSASASASADRFLSSLPRGDLEAFLRRLGPEPLTDDEISSLTLSDLSSLGSAPAEGSELRDAFGVFDADGDGKISAEELLGIFESLGDSGCSLDACRRMIGVVDRDGDGFVGFDDFVGMMELGAQRSDGH